MIDSVSKLAPKITGRFADCHQIGSFKRIDIVSNNACLFSCFNYLLHHNSLDIRQVRLLAAAVIEADAITFNDVTLDQPRAAYLNWIKQDDSWGGYLELIALSNVYNIQVVVIDVDTGRQDEYGTIESGKRIYLVYDGVHYDALVAQDLCCVDNQKSPYLTIFDPRDTLSLDKATNVVKEIQKKRKSFSGMELPLECTVCREPLPNQTAVKIHAAETGHTTYGERST